MLGVADATKQSGTDTLLATLMCFTYRTAPVAMPLEYRHTAVRQLMQSSGGIVGLMETTTGSVNASRLSQSILVQTLTQGKQGICLSGKLKTPHLGNLSTNLNTKTQTEKHYDKTTLQRHR